MPKKKKGLPGELRDEACKSTNKPTRKNMHESPNLSAGEPADDQQERKVLIKSVHMRELMKQFSADDAVTIVRLLSESEKAVLWKALDSNGQLPSPLSELRKMGTGALGIINLLNNTLSDEERSELWTAVSVDGGFAKLSWRKQLRYFEVARRIAPGNPTIYALLADVEGNVDLVERLREIKNMCFNKNYDGPLFRTDDLLVRVIRLESGLERTAKLIKSGKFEEAPGYELDIYADSLAEIASELADIAKDIPHAYCAERLHCLAFILGDRLRHISPYFTARHLQAIVSGWMNMFEVWSVMGCRREESVLLRLLRVHIQPEIDASLKAIPRAELEGETRPTTRTPNRRRNGSSNA